MRPQASKGLDRVGGARDSKETKQRLNMAKSKHELVEEAKAEAKQNLSGEDLEKCLTALDNWERNCY